MEHLDVQLVLYGYKYFFLLTINVASSAPPLLFDRCHDGSIYKEDNSRHLEKTAGVGFIYKRFNDYDYKHITLPSCSGDWSIPQRVFSSSSAAAVLAGQSSIGATQTTINFLYTRFFNVQNDSLTLIITISE